MKYDVRIPLRCQFMAGGRAYDTKRALLVSANRLGWAAEGDFGGLTIANLLRTDDGQFFSVTQASSSDKDGNSLTMTLAVLDTDGARKWCEQWETLDYQDQCEPEIVKFLMEPPK